VWCLPGSAPRGHAAPGQADLQSAMESLRTRGPVSALVVGAALLLSPGCGPSAPTGPTIVGQAEQTYTVKGRVVRLPVPPRQFLIIHHEPIPDFIDRQGRKVEMDEMEMDFEWIAPDAGLERVAAGDLVEVTFEVRWKGDPPTLVTRIKPLPAGTPVNIREVPAG
jgi:Cu/Ag efflux protein CusF